jgi:predicted kinase
LSKPLLIVISGPPCGGKTTIGRAVSREFCLPFFSKDDIKESLFNSLGWSDRAWSKKLGIGSEVLLFESVGKLLEVGLSVVAESAFRLEFDVPMFQELSRKYSYEILQVSCIADTDLLVSRFFQRAAGPYRHPGHAELANREEFEQYLESGVWKPLPIGGQVIEINTGDWDNLSFTDLFAAVRSLLSCTG